MIIHTLLYRFPSDVTAARRVEFLEALGDLTKRSPHVVAFGYGEHHVLPVDEYASNACATEIAQFACPDLEALKAFSEDSSTAAFLASWRPAMNYQAHYANHDDLLSTVPRWRGLRTESNGSGRIHDLDPNER